MCADEFCITSVVTLVPPRCNGLDVPAWLCATSQHVPDALDMVNADRLNVSYTASLICLG